MRFFLRQDSGAHPSLFQYFIASLPVLFLLLSCCLLLKSPKHRPSTAKWAVHLNQNCWPSGILFGKKKKKKRLEAGCMNSSPDSPPWSPMRQKKIHCQRNDWERLLSALAMGLWLSHFLSCLPTSDYQMPFCMKAPATSSSPQRQLELPRAEGPRELQLLHPLPVALVLTKQRHQVHKGVMFALVMPYTHCC